MNPTAHTSSTELDEPIDEPLPDRPRRRLLNRVTLPLLGLLLAAAGFLGGIEIEKGHGGATATASAAAARFAAGRFAAGAPTGSGAGGFGGGFPSGGGFGRGGAGGLTIGTVSSVSGKTLYVKETSGTTVKVSLTGATSLKKNLSVRRGSIHPGDSITVQGISGSGGSVKASSVTDSGHSSTGSQTSSSGGGA